MTPNHERAANIIRRHIRNAQDEPEYSDPNVDHDIAAASDLRREGLLTPDLPKPDHAGYWWPTHRPTGNITTRNGKIRITGGITDIFGQHRAYTTALTPEDARNLMHILAAALHEIEKEEP